MTILSSILWEQLITDRLSHCTDEIGFNYVMPGCWVHGEVQTVPEITAGPSPGGHDTIKEGWGVGGLWGLCGAGGLVSFGVSVRFASCGKERTGGLRQ